MPKKTAIEYEAMIGGLMTRIEDLYTKLGNATANAEAWETRAKKLEHKEPRLVIDWESMCKDRDDAIDELSKQIMALKCGEFICMKCGLRKDSDPPSTDPQF